MGQSAAETVKEIEETRGRLEDNIRQLETRLPAPSKIGKKAVGILAGGGVAGAAAIIAVKKMRSKRKAAKAAAAAISVPAVINVLPDDIGERIGDLLSDGKWKPYAAAAAGVWVLFRMAELRALKRVNRTYMPTVR